MGKEKEDEWKSSWMMKEEQKCQIYVLVQVRVKYPGIVTRMRFL